MQYCVGEVSHGIIIYKVKLHFIYLTFDKHSDNSNNKHIT